MKVNPDLEQAIDIFKKLGWNTASFDEVLNLPLGTPEQQKIALKGLRTGDWEEYKDCDCGHRHPTIVAAVNREQLGFYATRIGVDAKRAIEVLPHDKDRIKAAIVHERGREFAEEFVAKAFALNRWRNIQMRKAAVEVILRMGLDYPDTEPFYAAWVGELHGSLWGGERIPLELFEPTFATIFPTAFEQFSGEQFSVVWTAARLLEEGWIDRATAVNIALHSIGKGSTPTRRKDETLKLFNRIKATCEELLPHADRVCGLIATGETAMVEHFALPLIPIVDEAHLRDMALTALYAKTKKSVLAVLKALRDRPQPHPETQEVLLPRLDELAHGRDAATAKQATALIHHWGLDATEREDASLITYAWEDAPRLWELPRFERGVANVEKLAEAAQKLVAQKRDKYLDVSDIHIERFLALANELARTDVKAAQRALKGATQIAGGLFAEWAVRPQRKRYTIITYSTEIFPARLKQLLPQLGKLPCLLSEPSFVDLSITADDLVERLTWYHKAGAAVLEADLQLALARLNPTSITASTAGQLATLDVSVVLEDGTVFGRSATQIAREYLTDPVREPEYKLVAGEMVIKAFPLPGSLAGLPMRLQLNNWDETDYYCVFPHFGNAAFLNLRWSPRKDPEDAVGVMQVARHGRPLPPAAAMNLFAVQRPTKNPPAEFSVALHNAWQRGLIRPGAADSAFLDWRSKLGNLKSLALVLDDAAHAGMLSAVWPILDDLIGACIQNTNLVAGTAEVAVVMETLAPSVAAAIRDGLAPATAGRVPHLRQLAKRKGRNKAVMAARNVVAIVADASPDVAVES